MQEPLSFGKQFLPLSVLRTSSNVCKPGSSRRNLLAIMTVEDPEKVVPVAGVLGVLTANSPTG